MEARTRTSLRISLSILPGSMKALNQGMEKNLAKYHGEGSSNLGSEGVQAISSHLSIRIRPIGRVERSAASGTIKRRGAMACKINRIIKLHYYRLRVNVQKLNP